MCQYPNTIENDPCTLCPEIELNKNNNNLNNSLIQPLSNASSYCHSNLAPRIKGATDFGELSNGSDDDDDLI